MQKNESLILLLLFEEGADTKNAFHFWTTCVSSAIMDDKENGTLLRV